MNFKLPAITVLCASILCTGCSPICNIIPNTSFSNWAFMEHRAEEEEESQVVTLDDLDEPYNPFPEMTLRKDAFSAHLTHVTRSVFQRWIDETGYSVDRSGEARLIITDVRNDSGMELDEEHLRDIFADIGASDGRFHVVLASARTETARAYLESHLINDPYYSNSSLDVDGTRALQCVATLQITDLADSDRILLDLTLFDIENDQVAISDWDVFGRSEL